MRVVWRGPSKKALPWIERSFFAAAILLLSYCAFVVVDSQVFQRRESVILQHMLLDRNAAAGPLQFRRATLTPGAPAVAASGLIGRIQIPRLALSAVVIEGDDSKTLRRAVGHITGTPLPGQTGNVALTGHRDTFFRPLRNVRPNDVIVVTTLQGEYRYRVVSTKIVEPDNVSVLDSSDSQILTLVTCYPFYFVGAAPERFIVRAERIA
ncbi:MAG TPA: class D sortase [Bryobacteraceae bacterium]|nr:class D sortase [Bryobacteraceae bacterium]